MSRLDLATTRAHTLVAAFPYSLRMRRLAFFALPLITAATVVSAVV